MEFMNFMAKYKADLIKALFEHLQISLTAVTLAILIGVPVGIYISKSKSLSKYTLSTVSVFQTIPSLALFGLIIPVLGIGIKPAIFVLFLYALLPIIMNTYIGIAEVEDFLIESATGIGMSNKQILFKIKLPLAIPVMMGGIKVSTVTSIGTATIASLIGAGGLGDFIFRGIASNNNQLILLGAIPTAMLAIAVNYIMGIAETALTPKRNSRENSYIQSNRKKVLGSIAILFLIPILIVANIKYQEYTIKNKTIIIGHKNFTEQRILGEVYAQLIEEYTDYIPKVIELGGTQVVLQAITNDEVDIYPEYTGTAYISIFKQKDILDSEKTYQIVKNKFKEKYNLNVLDPLNFNNTFVFLTTKENSKKYNLKTISDISSHKGQFRLGSDNEYVDRQDGNKAVNKVYDIELKEIKGMDVGLLFPALKNNDLDIIVGYGTDGRIKKYDLTLLEDDKSFFPPYNVAPVVNSKVLKKHPEIEKVLNKLGGKISDNEMQELNYLVDEKGYTPREAAREFIKKFLN
ncbi:ABC transporter permease subunit (plasmid) [Fusobacteria bacterium ZRK30]|nr:ABC transporter permease subunit [Fusobacteria bacterium ZRK30]